MTKPYEKMANYYDLFYREYERASTNDQLEFLAWAFTNLAKRTVKRVLDVGCGTGRLLIPLAQRGYDVVGADASTEMLAAAKEKAQKAGLKLRLEHHDMRKLPYRDEFDALICMSTAFNHMLTDEDVNGALACFHRALKKGGFCVIDLMNWFSLIGRFREYAVQHGGADGVSFQRVVTHTFDDVPGIWYHDEFNTIVENGQTTAWREVHTLRMLTYHEMHRFLQDAGFSNIKCFGSFTDREEVKKSARRLIFVALKL